MNKILMLDLDETLFSNLFTQKGMETYVRPYAGDFLRETQKLFDSRYLCTHIGKETAFKILNHNFPEELINDFQYWPWTRFSRKSKGAGYGHFQDSLIVHVEDAMFPDEPDYKPNILKEEKLDFKKYEIVYIPVRQYVPIGIIEDKVILPEDDNELLRALNEIKTKVQRKP